MASIEDCQDIAKKYLELDTQGKVKTTRYGQLNDVN